MSGTATPAAGEHGSLPQPIAHPGITGATALVTGASRGIGAAIAAALAAAGARVVLTGRDRDALAEATGAAASVSTAGRRPIALAADLADADQVSSLHRRVLEQVGPVNLLVAAAGGLGDPVPLVSMTDRQWFASVDANLTTAFYTLRAFLPDMIEARRGSVVTVASTAGRQPSPASPAYGAANAGLLMLTRQAALQVGGHGVRLNAVAPGSIHTDRLDTLMPHAAQERLAAAHPLGRLGTPDDIARATLYLLSDQASWITGATLDVNGGRLMA
jgi:3-oxoacyl-[acyl-carrier protein] reductase